MAEKGFMLGSMKFAKGDEEGPAEVQEGPLLPLRILVVTSVVPNDEHNAGAAAPDSPVRVDLADPGQLFAKLRPRLRIEVPSVLDGGRLTKIDLAPTGLKSFRPDGLVQEVPLLRSLLEGKLILDRLRAAEISEDQAQAQLERVWGGSSLSAEVLGRTPRGREAAPATPIGTPGPRPAPAADTSGGGLDALLDMVEVPGASSEPQASSSYEGDERISKIIAEVALGSRARGGRGKTGIPMIEEAMGAQLGAILQHPEVRRIERAYRSIMFLAERAQRIPGVLIDVLAVPQDGAAAAFGRAVRRHQDVPFTLAVVDVDVDGSARSFTELEAIADAAEEACCPAFVNGTVKLLGVGDLSRINELDNKAALFTAPHRAPWRSTANKTRLRWVALAMNGVLLRAPYDKQSSRVREATIKESPADHEAFVWMSPAYAVAAVTIVSFKETGWPARITGARHGQVENLLVHQIDDDGAEVAIPTQAFVSTDSQRELGRLGVPHPGVGPEQRRGVHPHRADRVRAAREEDVRFPLRPGRRSPAGHLARRSAVHRAPRAVHPRAVRKAPQGGRRRRGGRDLEGRDLGAVRERAARRPAARGDGPPRRRRPCRAVHRRAAAVPRGQPRGVHLRDADWVTPPRAAGDRRCESSAWEAGPLGSTSRS